MKNFLLLVAALVLSSGCSLVSVHTSNFPLFSSGYSVHVVNESDYEIELFQNGCQLTFEFESGATTQRLKRGQSTLIRVRNWGDRSVEVSITAIAWKSDSNELIGTAYTKLYVQAGSSQTDVKPIRNQTFTGYSYESWWR